MRAITVLPWLLFLASCGSVDEPVSVPPQGRLLRPARFDRIGPYVTMGRPNAAMYFVRDISPNLESGSWRWTGKNPTLRFRVPAAEGLRFTMDFALPELAFRETGPVSITCRVNGRTLLTRRYTTPGEQQLSLPVPASLLPEDGETIVSAEIDKVWRTSIDGRDTELGFALVRAGFVQ